MDTGTPREVASDATLPQWRSLKTFCLFVGYGRSGHSVIGSLIDAHPQAVVSHELNAVKRLFAGIPRDALFAEIFDLAQSQARNGRRAPRAEGGSYVHGLDGQIKRSPDGITVLGDKKGAGTAWQFARHGLNHIETFRAKIGVPVKMLHVVRNPFDMAAARMARGGSDLSSLLPIVAEIRRRYLGADWLDIYHEDVVARPREEVARILQFLGLSVLADHLNRCAAHLYRAPQQRRFEVSWTAETRTVVEMLIARHEFLSRYEWKD